MKRGLLLGAALVVAAVALVGMRARGARVEHGPPSAIRHPPSAEQPSGVPQAEGQRRKAEGVAAVAAKPTRGEVVISGRWGGGDGQFGRRRDPESNPEAPMAVVAGARGELAVLDQVNRRILRYRDGKLVATVATGGDTIQDLAFARDGRLLALDRLVDGNVQIYGADGKLADSLSLAGKNVPEGGAVTGLFTDDDGIYVERDHQALVRIAGADGTPDPDRPELVGRPSRDGRTLLSAAIADRQNGVVLVRAFDRASGQPLWSQALPLGVPVLHIITLDSDRNGMVYVAADVGREADAPPYPIVDEQLMIARLGSGGTPRGLLALPPLPGADESFRPITVADDGTVYVMANGDGGLTVTRYTF